MVFGMASAPHLLNSIDEGLGVWFRERGQGGYRVGQVRKWLFARRATDFNEMTDLPQAVRGELAEAFALWTTQIVRHTQAEDGTEKLLLGLADGGQVECVLLRDEVRRTICISTQVGPASWGCVFCASGLDGLARNLTTGEIVEQMLRLQTLLAPEERLSHIVVMGMGEPLANLDALLPALEEAGREMGWESVGGGSPFRRSGYRSQCGNWRRRAPATGSPFRFHAPNDALRREIVPTGREDFARDDSRRGRSLLRALGPAADVRICAAVRHQRQRHRTPKNWRICWAIERRWSM